MKMIKIGKTTYDNVIHGVIDEGFYQHCLKDAEYSKRSYWVMLKTRRDAEEVLKLDQHCRDRDLITSGNGRVFKHMREQALALIADLDKIWPKGPSSRKNSSEEELSQADSGSDKSSSENARTSQTKADKEEPYRPRDNPPQPPQPSERLYDYKKLRPDVLDRTEQMRDMFKTLFQDQVREITSLRRMLGRVLGDYERTGEISGTYIESARKNHPEVLEWILGKD